jgi:phosphotriesterase-related protein
MELRRIITVLGDIDPSALGFCQSHEHLSIARTSAIAGAPGQQIDDPEKSLAELRLYYAAGGRALVDAQPVGCGRDADMLVRISEKSGVHIIASTGFHKLSFYPEDHWLHSAGEEDLTCLFIAELNQGMYLNGDTAFPSRQGSAQAGQIKTALDTEGMSPRYQKLFAAAAEAAMAAGCALMAHIEKDADPRRLADFLLKRGLSPNRTIFCHLDRAITDVRIHREICEQGIYLEYDTIGRPKYHDDEKEAAIVLELVEAGYEKQLLMSLDTTRARLASYGGAPGLTHILDAFIPLLLRRGLTENHIRGFFVENPARALSATIINNYGGRLTV